ncbi:MAG: hypothetical protein U0232_30025 [Thermomicrobiales bacterium]
MSRCPAILTATTTAGPGLTTGAMAEPIRIIIADDHPIVRTG